MKYKTIKFYRKFKLCYLSNIEVAHIMYSLEFLLKQDGLTPRLELHTTLIKLKMQRLLERWEKK